ncbi:C4-dicarboxylate ABC transporter [Halomonas litopenaei]|nr:MULTISPECIES: TRAP transporter permease [Halomonas]MBY5941543.1 TRAP transporter permease [Halomonas sp. DP5N14-9]PTL93671.1 C4-dicarboxylate ABC transporter [Halomonas sp. SYSU XM8]PTL95757.1 C4-dicarboxylate ABC transporter [Halomonas litopenaei]
MVEKTTADAPRQLLEKYDRESSVRAHLGRWGWAVSLLGIALTSFHLYTGYFGTLPSQQQGAVHLGLALGMIFLLFPACRGERARRAVPWYDVVLAFTATFGAYYKILFYDEVLRARITGYSTLDLIVAGAGVLFVLEATRRTVGLPIVIVALLALAYALLGNHIPTALLSHPGFSLEQVAPYLWFRESGVFGTPLQISAKFIFLFLFFGVVLIQTGVGRFFNDLAFAATGRFTGGTAKAAVIASSLQGMISGSSVGNTVASGSFTIPMMKNARFRPEVAAATEASASTGGQIMPPLMGAAAFIMVEYVGVSYREIMYAALIPALMYFTGIFIGVHFEAKRSRILGIPKDQLPSKRKLLMRQGYMLLPLAVIVTTVSVGFTAQRAALLGIAAALAVSLLRKETRPSLADLVRLLDKGARVALPVIAAVATAGIIAGVVGMTGLGAKFAAGIISLADGTLILALIFTMLACIVLGMGLPTTANYVVTATIAAPALINEFGLAPMAVHLFVFYFGIVADITPPVCLAAYAGAGIAGANPMKTGVTALKLAIGAFIIPYALIYNPALVMIDATPLGLVRDVGFLLVGLVGVSAALIGHFVRDALMWERAVLLAAGLAMVAPAPITSSLGLVALALVALWQSRRPEAPLDTATSAQR